MCIYLSDNAIYIIIFIIGLVVGSIITRIIIKNRFNLSDHERYELSQLKLEAAISKYELSHKQSPPKPLHNPHK